jgi:Holliday junction resolvasome RuvABC endonuclease subunit
MKILGFDVSKVRTGWAVLDNMNIVHYGFLACPKDFYDKTNLEESFNDLLKWYYDNATYLIAQYEPDIVVLEDLNIQFNIAAKTILQIQSAIKVSVKNYVKKNIALKLIHNKTVKSYFKIKNDPSYQNNLEMEICQKYKIKKVVKVRMILTINEIFDIGLNWEQNDEADAIALACVCYLKGVADVKEEKGNKKSR